MSPRLLLQAYTIHTSYNIHTYLIHGCSFILSLCLQSTCSYLHLYPIFMNEISGRDRGISPSLLLVLNLLSATQIYYTSFINLQLVKSANGTTTNSVVIANLWSKHACCTCSLPRLQKQAEQSLVRNDYKSAFTWEAIYILLLFIQIYDKVTSANKVIIT